MVGIHENNSLPNGFEDDNKENNKHALTRRNSRRKKSSNTNNILSDNQLLDNSSMKKEVIVPPFMADIKKEPEVTYIDTSIDENNNEASNNAIIRECSVLLSDVKTDDSTVDSAADVCIG